jgi:predicted DNA-binding protein
MSITVHFVPTPEQAEKLDALVDQLPRTSRSSILRVVVERGLDGITPDDVHAAVQTDPVWVGRQPATRRPKATAGEGASK